LVLQMAIQGRLVQQDPTDEPANATLLKYPSTVSAKFIKTPDAGTPCPKITLPLGWVWNRLTNVLKKLTDGTHHSPPNSNFGEFPYVTAKNIKNHGIEISNLTYVTKELHNEIFSRCNPEHGDLLYIKDGATTGIVAINQLREEFSMLSSVALLKLTGAIDNRYLLWTLRSPFFYNQIRAAMKGAAITRVNLTELAQTWIPLPPLAEQKRIVAKVDELMGLCDELEAQQQERELRKSVLVRSSLSRFAESPTRENLGYLFHNSYDIPPSELRKSILTLAVQGKLVPQDPNDEPAMALLQQIKLDKSLLVKEGKLRGSTTITPMEAQEGEFEIPSSWTWVPFGQIMVNRDGERIPVSKEERESKSKTYDYYGASGVIDKIDNYLFDKPLLLIGEDGANLINRSTPIAFIARGKYWVNNHAHVLDGISEDFLRYIELHINAINLERYITGSAQPKMNQAKMNSIPIALPPLAEQRRIVAKVNQLMALVDELERQQEASREKATKLLDAIVHEMTIGGQGIAATLES
jgi:type I restriction enzyme S subunit